MILLRLFSVIPFLPSFLSYINESAAELRAKGPSAPAACSSDAGKEHAVLRCTIVLPGLRS